MIAQPGAALRVGGATVASATGADVTSLADALAAEGIALRPLFGLNEERLQLRAAALAAAAPAAAAAAAAAIPDLSRYYTVDARPSG